MFPTNLTVFRPPGKQFGRGGPGCAEGGANIECHRESRFQIICVKSVFIKVFSLFSRCFSQGVFLKVVSLGVYFFRLVFLNVYFSRCFSQGVFLKVFFSKCFSQGVFLKVVF